jgi:hypothetical protein
MSFTQCAVITHCALATGFLQSWTKFRIARSILSGKSANVECAIVTALASLASEKQLRMQVAWMFDFSFFLSNWYKQARGADPIRCFPSGFTAHQAISHFVNRQQVLSTLAQTLQNRLDHDAATLASQPLAAPESSSLSSVQSAASASSSSSSSASLQGCDDSCTLILMIDQQTLISLNRL